MEHAQKIYEDPVAADEGMCDTLLAFLKEQGWTRKQVAAVCGAVFANHAIVTGVTSARAQHWVRFFWDWRSVQPPSERVVVSDEDTDLAAVVDELRRKRDQHQRAMSNCDIALRDAKRRLCRKEHPCSCVRLNAELGVVDMITEDRARRNTLQFTGFTAELLSADRDCERCGGTGIPMDREATA